MKISANEGRRYGRRRPRQRQRAFRVAASCDRSAVRVLSPEARCYIDSPCHWKISKKGGCPWTPWTTTARIRFARLCKFQVVPQTCTWHALSSTHPSPNTYFARLQLMLEYKGVGPLVLSPADESVSASLVELVL